MNSFLYWSTGERETGQPTTNNTKLDFLSRKCKKKEKLFLLGACSSSSSSTVKPRCEDVGVVRERERERERDLLHSTATTQ